MTKQILKIVAKEVGWFFLAWNFSYIIAIFFFLLLESVGFTDDPTVNEYWQSPIFFNAGLFAHNIAFLFFAVLRMDLENEKIVEWHNTKPIKSGFFKYAGLGVGASLIIYAFDYLEFSALLNFFDESQVAKTYWSETGKFGFGEKIFLLIDSVIFTPIVEELYFRQAMLGSIHRIGFPNFAMFFSCAVFAIIHFDFLHIFAYLFSGIVLAILYIKTRSLVSSMIAHSLINLIAFSIILFG